MRGRTIVRFLGQDGGFFQAVFDPETALLRVDLAVADAPTLDLCDLAILARLSAKGKPAIKTPLNLGCFFDPGEYRFEINAFAVEGEPFLDLYQELNPLARRIRLEGSPPGVGARLSRLARLSILVLDVVGAIRPRGRLPGKLSRTTRPGRMGVSQHRLVQHRSLGAYRLVEGEPRQTKVIQHSDGPVSTRMRLAGTSMRHSTGTSNNATSPSCSHTGARSTGSIRSGAD